MSGAQATAPCRDFLFEDIEIGREFVTAAHLVTADEVAGFATLTRDRHPLHLDPDYARSRGFPALIAHGLFGLSLMEGLKAELALYETTSVASLGWDEVRFRSPILVGDVLRVRFRFVGARATRDPGRGVVVEALELLNDREEVVTTARHTSLILTRHGAC